MTDRQRADKIVALAQKRSNLQGEIRAKEEEIIGLKGEIMYVDVQMNILADMQLELGLDNAG